MPKTFAVPAHDLELCDRALVPVLNLAQDRLDIFSHCPRAQPDVGDHSGADVVGKISSGSNLVREVGIESDFVGVHLWTSNSYSSALDEFRIQGDARNRVSEHLNGQSG